VRGVRGSVIPASLLQQWRAILRPRLFGSGPRLTAGGCERSSGCRTKRKGGGVRAKLNEGNAIARNKEYWANIRGNNTRQRDEKGDTPQTEREQARGQRTAPTAKEPDNNKNDDRPARRKTGKPTRHEPPITNSPCDEVTRGRGGEGGARGAPASGGGQSCKQDEAEGQRPRKFGDD
jgi:hypothetical protein